MIRQSILVIKGLIVLKKLKEIWSWLEALYDSLLARIKQISLYDISSEISSLLEKIFAVS